jgi:hypothetical protein
MIIRKNLFVLGLLVLLVSMIIVVAGFGKQGNTQHAKWQPVATFSGVKLMSE